MNQYSISQDVEVAKFLEEMNVTTRVLYIGETDKCDWKCDQWAFVFTRKNKTVKFDFFTGTGLRIEKKAKPIALARRVYESKSQRVVYGVSSDPYLLAIIPSQATVLHSLISDRDLAQESFPYFCAELGYSEDSRKALDLYLDCQKQGEELSKIFSHSEIKAIEEILEDY